MYLAKGLLIRMIFHLHRMLCIENWSDTILKVLPSTDTFTLSAVLEVVCPYPQTIITLYTLDGSIPNPQTSLSKHCNEQIVIDTIGKFILTVISFNQSNLIVIPNDPLIRNIRVLDRMQPPSIQPPGGSYLGNIRVKFSCKQAFENMVHPIVFYTNEESKILFPKKSTSNKLKGNCDSFIDLNVPGHYNIKATLGDANHNFSESATVEQSYELKLPAYDKHFISQSSNGFQVQPDVEVWKIEKDLAEVGSHEPRRIRGRVVLLYNPSGHFDVIPPVGGCRSGSLELPSISGRHYRPRLGLNLTQYFNRFIDRFGMVKDQTVDAAFLNRTISNEAFLQLLPFPYNQFMDSTTTLSTLSDWDEQYSAAAGLGCQLVSNAGFFNTVTNECIGNIVGNGEIFHSSHNHNVNFGMYNGSFVIGYVDLPAAGTPESDPPFDFLISGLGWLVRNGQSYIEYSLSSEGDREDLSIQSTGSQFSHVRSARTAIGFNAAGQLMILQVEGETWVRGMDLFEFAALAVEVGFESAINLDGGGSATMTQNHSLISQPSWKCLNDQLLEGQYRLKQSNQEVGDLFRCEKKVSSITCIHAMPPPFLEIHHIPSFQHSVPSPPLTVTSEPTPAPSQSSAVNSSKSFNDDWATLGSYQAAIQSMQWYQAACYVISALLGSSLLLHAYCLYRWMTHSNQKLMAQSGEVPIRGPSDGYDVEQLDQDIHPPQQNQWPRSVPSDEAMVPHDQRSMTMQTMETNHSKTESGAPLSDWREELSSFTLERYSDENDDDDEYDHLIARKGSNNGHVPGKLERKGNGPTLLSSIMSASSTIVEKFSRQHDVAQGMEEGEDGREDDQYSGILGGTAQHNTSVASTGSMRLVRKSRPSAQVPAASEAPAHYDQHQQEISATEYDAMQQTSSKGKTSSAKKSKKKTKLSNV